LTVLEETEHGHGLWDYARVFIACWVAVLVYYTL
jgi:hypothetical protein